MSKNLILPLFLILGMFCLVAQNGSTKQHKDEVYLLVMDNDIVQVKDCDQVLLENDITLNNGTVVYTDGTYLTPAGELLSLQNGECFDMNGTIYPDEYLYHYAMKQENKGLTTEQLQEKSLNRYQLILIDGEMYKILNHNQLEINSQMSLKNGTVINPDGTYRTMDPKRLRLLDGECLNMNGEIFRNIYQLRKELIQKNKEKKAIAN